MALFLEFGNELGHLWYVFCSPGHKFGDFQIQRPAILEKGLFKSGGILPHAKMIASGVADDLVVHVRDIHHVIELVAAAAQEASQNVNRDEGAEVPDVSVVIDSRAAGVHSNLLRFDGAEVLEF